MTEERILQLINNKNKQDKHAKFIPENVDSIAEAFGNIIFDSLKLKSSSASLKRINTLNLLRKWTAKNDSHVSVNDSNVGVFLNTIKKSYNTSVVDQDLAAFLKVSKLELEEYTNKPFATKVVEFYKQKNDAQRKRNKLKEYIKSVESTRLQNTKVDCTIEKFTSNYETNENLIRKILNSESTGQTVQENKTNHDFRESQIAFGYSVLNFNDLEEQNIHLNNLFANLGSYKELLNCERSFIEYLVKYIDKIEVVKENLLQDFFFIFEQYILQICTQIIKIKNEEIYATYILTLEHSEKFQNLIQLCRENSIVKNKIICIIMELYNYSLCHKSIIKLTNYF